MDLLGRPFEESERVSTQQLDAFRVIFEQIGADGKFNGREFEALRLLGKERKAVVLAFPPKAAGTFLRNSIIEAIDGKLVRVAHALGGRDATPYLPTFVAYYSGALTERTLVAHVHMLALPANRHFLEVFDIRPVVMMRSIPDMLASYWDMLDTDAVARGDGLNCIIPEDFQRLPDAAKADFLVDILGPWYTNYFAGWLGYTEADPGRVCVLHYRDFKDDPAGALATALDHVGLSRTPGECQAAIDLNWTNRRLSRFNKGEEGRGGRYLKAVHMNRLARMLGHYPKLAPYAAELLDTGPEWRTTANG